MQKIMDGRTLRQKFRVGDHREIDIRVCKMIAHYACHEITRTHRYRALIDNYGFVVKLPGNITRSALHVAHIRLTLAGTCWRINGDKNKIAVIQSLAIAGCKVQSSRSYVTLHQFLQSRLVNGQRTLPQQGNLRLYNINTCHAVPHVGKTGTRYQSHITRANYTNLCHTIYVSSFLLYMLISRATAPTMPLSSLFKFRRATYNGDVSALSMK